MNLLRRYPPMLLALSATLVMQPHAACGVEFPPLFCVVGPKNDLSGLMPKNLRVDISSTFCGESFEHMEEYLMGKKIGMSRAHIGKREYIPILEKSENGESFVPPAGFRTILLKGHRMTPQMEAQIQGFNASMLLSYYTDLFIARKEKEAAK